MKGNLTRDPELREIPRDGESTTVANFTIAVSRYYKRKGNTETEQSTEYVDCEAWDTGAQTIGKILSKGDPVLVEGSTKKDNWEDSEGNKRSRTKVRVDRFERLFRKPAEDANPAEASSDSVEPVEVSAGSNIDF